MSNLSKVANVNLGCELRQSGSNAHILNYCEGRKEREWGRIRGRKGIVGVGERKRSKAGREAVVQERARSDKRMDPMGQVKDSTFYHPKNDKQVKVFKQGQG